MEHSPASRRVFLTAGGIALLGSHRSLRALARRTSAGQAPFQLKSQAQYQREAAEFEAGIRDLQGAARMATASEADQENLRTLIDAAGARLDHHFSWLVVRCLEDQSLTAWVRQQFRDAATFEAFATRLERSPRVAEEVDGISALRNRLEGLERQRKAIVEQIIKLRRVEAAMATFDELRPLLVADNACTKTWSVMTAVVLVVISIVAAVTTRAGSLGSAYKGTGPDAEARHLAAANERYQQCVRAASALPRDQRAKALAVCQADWLGSKIALFA